jgi:hypothetical protein
MDQQRRLFELAIRAQNIGREQIGADKAIRGVFGIRLVRGLVGVIAELGWQRFLRALAREEADAQPRRQ